jgi:hypothetical protein
MRNRQASEERRLYMENAPDTGAGTAQQGASSDVQE